MSNARAAVEIPFVFQDGMIWLKVTPADKSLALNFLLDTGAGVTVLDLAAARKLGLKPGPAETVRGVQGRAVAYRFERFAAATAGVPIPSSALGLDVSGLRQMDGLLGIDFLRNRITEIDFTAQKIRFLDRAELDSASYEEIPLTKRNGVFCARISVNGNPHWMRLDTGCNSALEWVENSVRESKSESKSIAMTKGASRVIPADVEVGSTHLPAVKTGVHDKPLFPGESGLLGTGVLSKFRVILDAPKSRLLLAKVNG